jgi:ABC-type multidrug transport system fused ATPase/permease subunit
MDICELKKDIEILPGGDQTEIGEKGINLSGGQKARVAIARAIYKSADLILLDDPLAAVDVHVGSSIFNRCFRKHCKGKTVVLVTNGQQFLPFVDKIIVVHEGKIVETGSYNDLVDMGGFFS